MTKDRRPRCSVEGCNEFAVAKGLCSKHYQRLRTSGAPDAPSRRERLSNADVVDIRRAKERRGLCVYLARKYGVSESAISAIRRGERRVAPIKR